MQKLENFDAFENKIACNKNSNSLFRMYFLLFKKVIFKISSQIDVDCKVNLISFIPCTLNNVEYYIVDFLFKVIVVFCKNRLFYTEN